VSETVGAMVLVLREAFAGYVIRRDVNAVDDKGVLISGLKPWFEILFELKMTPWEQQLFEHLIDLEGQKAQQTQVGSHVSFLLLRVFDLLTKFIGILSTFQNVVIPLLRPPQTLYSQSSVLRHLENGLIEAPRAATDSSAPPRQRGCLSSRSCKLSLELTRRRAQSQQSRRSHGDASACLNAGDGNPSSVTQAERPCTSRQDSRLQRISPEFLDCGRGKQRSSIDVPHSLRSPTDFQARRNQVLEA